MPKYVDPKACRTAYKSEGSFAAAGRSLQVSAATIKKHVRSGRRTDAWANIDTGLGLATSKGRATSFYCDPPPTPDTLEAMFQCDWLTQRIVRMDPDMAMLRGFESDDAAKDAYKAQNFPHKYADGVFQTGLYKGRLYGGALIAGGFASDPTQPYRDGDQLRWLEVYSNQDVAIHATQEDANEPDFGQPTMFRVQQGARVGLVMHASKTILCEGSPAIGDRKRTELEDYWSESVIRAPLEALERYGLTWAAVSHLIQEMDVAIVKLKGLIEAIGSENSQEFIDRLRLMNRTKGVAGMMLLDADSGEEFTRQSANLSNLPQLLAQLQADVAAAANIPATLLFRKSPDGMNATGDSDIRLYYDTLANYQLQSLTRKLETLLQWMTGSEQEVTWLPLWQPTELEEQQIRNEMLKGDLMLQDLGVDGIEIAKSRDEAGELGVELSDEAFVDGGEEEPEPGIPPVLGNDQTFTADLPQSLESGAPDEGFDGTGGDAEEADSEDEEVTE